MRDGWGTEEIFPAHADGTAGLEINQRVAADASEQPQPAAMLQNSAPHSLPAATHMYMRMYMSHMCSHCNELLPAVQFSTSQLAKKATRRCKICVIVAQQPQQPQQLQPPTTLLCAQCNTTRGARAAEARRAWRLVREMRASGRQGD